MPARIDNTFMGENQAFARGSPGKMLDPSQGGQFGFAPDIRSLNSNAAYVRHPLIAILMELPRAFRYVREGEKYAQVLRALIEERAVSITGLNAGYQIEVDGTPVGGTGQTQNEVVNVTEVPSNVTYRWNELYGMPITKFWRLYVSMFMMDPSTKYAGLATMARGQRIRDMLPDMYTFSVLYIEPDPVHQWALKAWLVTNMFPQDNTGEILGSRDLTQSMELMPIDISFGGVYQYNDGTLELAQRFLDEMDLTGASPLGREAFIQEIQADVAATRNGYKAGIGEVARQQVTNNGY